MSYIYLDHAASTPVFPRIEKDLDFCVGNPSSQHEFGQKSRSTIDQSRERVASFFEVKSREIIFTSGATESLHLAIIGGYLAKKKKYKKILVSPLSHSGVWASLDFLKTHFDVCIEYLPIDKAGFIDADKISESSLKSSDMVISEYGNSELGICQEVNKLGKKIIAVSSSEDKPIFVVDLAASMFLDPLGLKYFKADFLSFSGEKIGALAGSGVLVKSSSVDLAPMIGGSQEWGFRGGSENVLGIKAIEKALDHISKNRTKYSALFCEWHAMTRSYFKKNLGDCFITTPEVSFLPHVFHFVLPEDKEKASLFVAQADIKGLALSAGSACSSGSVEGSRALKALGFTKDLSQRGLRLSFGWNNKPEEIKKALSLIKTIYEE